MNHVAVDLGSKQSHFCIRSADGTIQQEGAVKTKDLKKFFELRAPPNSRIILESCAESFAVADAARETGHQPIIVASTLAPSLGVGEHGVKTDKRDARALSKTSCRVDLEGIHIPSQESRDAKTLLSLRQTMVELRTKLVNSVRGVLRARIATPGKGTTKTFPERVRATLAVEDLQLLEFVEPMLKLIEEANKRIAEFDVQVKKRAAADPVVKNLMTCEGVAEITALGFRATIDDVSRFRAAPFVYSYLGLAPGEDSSSQRQRKTGITKAGSVFMRRTLVQAAWCNMKKPKAGKQQRPLSDMQQWAIGVAERRGRAKAAVALARKMAGILFAMWRDNKPFERSMTTED